MPGPGLDADRALALAYVPAARREPVSALWELDATLGSLLASGTQPAVTQIKLAWWREALEALDVGRIPAEPLLQRLHRLVLSQDISGTDLAVLPSGWEILLEPGDLRPENFADHARDRGERLFALSARLLGSAADLLVAEAGAGWSLVDLARRNSSMQEREAALDFARRHLFRKEVRWPVSLRPLGMLAQLARRDVVRGAARFEAQGSPARMLAMLRHRLTGR